MTETSWMGGRSVARPAEDARPLTQYVVDSAQREIMDKAKADLPALRMGAVAGALGALAVAASYRLSLALLERALPAEVAALVATAVYGTGAGCAAAAAMRRWRSAPTPLPAETARRLADAVTDKEP